MRKGADLNKITRNKENVILTEILFVSHSPPPLLSYPRPFPSFRPFLVKYLNNVLRYKTDLSIIKCREYLKLNKKVL